MKGLICFLTGAAVGAVGTFFYIQKYVIPQIKDDILQENAEKEPEKEQGDIKRFAAPTEDDSVPDPVVSDYASRTSAQAKVLVDYSNYSRDPSTTITTATVNETPKEEIKDATADGGTPYLIDANSFDEFSSYNAHAFVLYSDGVVIDDDTEEILDEDPELVFGKTAMDVINSGKEDIIYIRNDEKKQDYSLERRDYPFDGPSDVYRVADPDDWRD